MAGIIDTPDWAEIDALAHAWGYDDASGPHVTVDVDESLTALLTGVRLEYAALSGKCAGMNDKIVWLYQTIARLEAEAAEHQGHIQHLTPSVDPQPSRTILRLVDRMSRLTTRLARHRP